MKEVERENGYYWVHDGEDWLIAYYNRGFWRYNGQAVTNTKKGDEGWAIIEETRILSPVEYGH